MKISSVVIVGLLAAVSTIAESGLSNDQIAAQALSAKLSI